MALSRLLPLAGRPSAPASASAAQSAMTASSRRSSRAPFRDRTQHSRSIPPRPSHSARSGNSPPASRNSSQALRFDESRSAEHTSELQSLIRTLYAFSFLKKKKQE